MFVSEKLGLEMKTNVVIRDSVLQNIRKTPPLSPRRVEKRQTETIFHHNQLAVRPQNRAVTQSKQRRLVPQLNLFGEEFLGHAPDLPHAMKSPDLF
jgi:hypothetical protein